MAKEFKKIETTKKLKDVLANNVNEQRLKHHKEYKDRIDNSLIKCESPIEQLFAMELEKYKLDNFHVFNKNIKLLKYSRQEPFVARNEKSFRLDFYFEFLFTSGLDAKIYKFAVELDGKQYHDKENATEIENRRWLSNSLGGNLIVFQGHEVYYKTKECVEKFIDEVIKQCDNFINSNSNFFKRNGFGL